MTDNEHLMRYALTLAEHGRGRVEPNPLVAALVVIDGEVIADGWHAKFGEAHAEVVALQRAGERARGATLYVTLEPCCHFGKTPPCVDALLAAGIRRVVVGMADPFPEVAGQGIAKLRSAGVEVVVGICESEARRLNRPYLTLIQKGRPYVHLKWAMTLDGKLATRIGDSKWISGEASRKIVHELRGRMDAIIVGAGTVRKDDSLLTARPPGPRTPARIVLSSKPELPAGCQLLTTANESPVIVATGAGSANADSRVELLRVAMLNGRPSVAALIAELGKRRMTNVLVEGGAEVFDSFLDARVVDEVHVFIAPSLVGGLHATSVGGIGIELVADALRLSEWTVQEINGDIYVHGFLGEPGA